MKQFIINLLVLLVIFPLGVSVAFGFIGLSSLMCSPWDIIFIVFVLLVCLVGAAWLEK